MKKQFKSLRLNKQKVSLLKKREVKGGSPTTDQSQYCPVPLPFPPEPYSANPVECIRGSYNSQCILCQ